MRSVRPTAGAYAESALPSKAPPPFGSVSPPRAPCKPGSVAWWGMRPKLRRSSPRPRDGTGGSLALGLRRAGALLVSDDGASFGRTAAHQVAVLQHLADAGYAHLDESSRYSRLIQHPGLIAAAELGNLTALAWAPLLALGGVIALRRRAPLAALFLGLCLAAIVGNALIIGVGGDVEGRYHGRVAWLAVFGCYLAAVSSVVGSTRTLPVFAWRTRVAHTVAEPAVEYPRNT